MVEVSDVSTHNDTTMRHGIVYWLRNLRDRMKAASMRRANMRELSGMSEHLLRDIGYDPQDIGGGLRRPEDQ